MQKKDKQLAMKEKSMRMIGETGNAIINPARILNPRIGVLEIELEKISHD
jgi:hypothetical protein